MKPGANLQSMPIGERVRSSGIGLRSGLDLLLEGESGGQPQLSGIVLKRSRDGFDHLGMTRERRE